MNLTSETSIVQLGLLVCCKPSPFLESAGSIPPEKLLPKLVIIRILVDQLE